MARAWVWWGILSAFGLLTILLPDPGGRLFSLSEEHGPSLIDSMGIVLLLVGWAALDIASWRRRHGLAFGREILALMAIVERSMARG